MADRTIRELTDNIEESIRAFQQIVAGSSQQQIGFADQAVETGLALRRQDADEIVRLQPLGGEGPGKPGMEALRRRRCRPPPI